MLVTAEQYALCWEGLKLFHDMMIKGVYQLLGYPNCETIQSYLPNTKGEYETNLKNEYKSQALDKNSYSKTLYKVSSYPVFLNKG